MILIKHGPPVHQIPAPLLASVRLPVSCSWVWHALMLARPDRALFVNFHLAAVERG